jgi:lysyl-tRNA synthetase class 2
MRRSPDCDNGVVELMVTDLMCRLTGTGISQVSLNFAVFRGVFERGSRLGAGPVLRLWRAVLLRASRFWQLESLYRANAKYRPEWHPRYLCFSSARDLAMVLVAAMQAEALLPRPRLTWGRPAHAAVPPADRADAAVAIQPAPVGRALRRDRRTGGVIR